MSDMSGQGGIKSITVSRKIIRANGTEEEEEVVAYWDQDPETMARVLGSGGGMLLHDDGTITPAAPNVQAVHPSERLLNMTREELEGGPR